MEPDFVPVRPALEHLPLELITKILDHIWPMYGTLASLAATNKELYQCVVPHLYRDIVLFEDAAQTERDIKLTYTLLRNKTIPSNVKSLRYGTAGDKLSWLSKDKTVCETVLGDTIHAQIIWKYSDAKMVQMLVFEHLLLKMDKLESIWTDLCWSKDGIGLSALTRRCSESKLRRLKRFELRDGRDLNFCIALLSRSRVQSAIVSNHDEMKSLVTSFQSPGSWTSTIKSLELINCVLSKGALEHLLPSCRNLTHFTYQVKTVGYRFTYNLQDMANAADFVDVLSKYTKHLKSLRLSVNRYWSLTEAVRDTSDICIDIPEENTIPSLKGFQNLTDLDIYRFDLTRAVIGDEQGSDLYIYWLEDLGSDDDEELVITTATEPSHFLQKFPKSLEQLTIRDPTKSIVPILVTLPDEVSNGNIPNLRTLRFTGDKSICDDIIKACIEWTSSPISYYYYDELHHALE